LKCVSVSKCKKINTSRYTTHTNIKIYERRNLLGGEEKISAYKLSTREAIITKFVTQCKVTGAGSMNCGSPTSSGEVEVSNFATTTVTPSISWSRHKPTTGTFRIVVKLELAFTISTTWFKQNLQGGRTTICWSDAKDIRLGTTARVFALTVTIAFTAQTKLWFLQTSLLPQ
jgi:hypothetical protein